MPLLCHSVFSYDLRRYPHPFFFFFNDPATTEIYTLSLHDALPIYDGNLRMPGPATAVLPNHHDTMRSEEHTSELQSQSNLVCRLLLEKKKKKSRTPLRP